jgi:hypothetical protein
MRKMMTMMAFVAVLGIYGVANAVSPCCAVKACPDGKTAVKGASPAEAKCCTNPADPATCTSVPNAGYACNSATSDPTSPNSSGAGCVEATDSVCAGGDPSQPAGCISAGGQGTTTFLGGNCTDDAVDGCCDAGACH